MEREEFELEACADDDDLVYVFLDDCSDSGREMSFIESLEI